MQKVVVAIIHNNSHFIFLKRTNGVWTFPSGKVENTEDEATACERETLEETGVTIQTNKFLGERFVEEHNITLLYYACDFISGSPTITEPDKFSEVGWKNSEELLHLTNGNIFPAAKAYILEQTESQKTPTIEPNSP